MLSVKDPVVQEQLRVRLRRAEGQLRGVQRMVEESANVADIAQQIASVRSALQAAGAELATAAIVEQSALGGKNAEALRTELLAALTRLR